MTLITSISGIRGTIGGPSGEGLTPLDAVRFTAAFAEWLKRTAGRGNLSVVLGRDARISGPMLEQIITGTLCGMGINVVNLGLATTPTVEMAVTEVKADGGIILTASHNPGQWNALKLLNGKGEFLSGDDGRKLLEISERERFDFAPVDALGKVSSRKDMDGMHISKILGLPLVNREKIRAAGFRVAIDCVNSVGGKILPDLLKALGVDEVIELFCEPTGAFPHNPEPLPANLREISDLVKEKKADVGFVVDPDVDRLAIVCEDGSMFGEEYTLVAVADYVLKHTPGDTCSNLSSSRALKVVTASHGQQYHASAVGEVNVVEKMKEKNCVIGGEGNGGVIYPELHYGRDALVGIALFLSHLANQGISSSELRRKYPRMEMIKHKIELSAGTDIDRLLDHLTAGYQDEEITTVDGLKIDFEDKWVHLRKSNTEPIIRVYAEASLKRDAEDLVDEIVNKLENYLGEL